MQAVVLGKPVTQILQDIGKGRKMEFFIPSTYNGVGDTDIGINPCFMDIKSTIVVFEF